MKKILLTNSFLIFTIISTAQVSESTMMAKIKSKHAKNLISAKFDGSPIAEKIFEEGVWNNYYRRSYTVKSKTQHTGVTQVYSGGIQYKKAGSSYVYDQLLVGDWHYLGIPDPNKADVVKLLKSDYKKFIESYHYNKIVGTISEITFPTNGKYHWNKLTSVTFNVKVTYAESVSYTELEKAEHTYEIRLYADKFKGPWKSFFSSEQSHKRKVISKSTHTSEELAAMKTLADIDDENLAKAEYADLPDVGELPTFESDKQLFYFLHNIIMTKDAKTVKAYLYKSLSKLCMHSELLLKSRDQEWVDQVFNNVATYKKTHCLYPKVKHEQNGMISFYDKENRRILDFNGSYEGEVWKLRSIKYYPAKASDVARMENIQNNCQEKPNLTVRKEVKYEIGDIVDVKFSNGTFAATIDKKDTSFSNRYYVKLLEGGRGYWMTEDLMSPSATKRTPKKMGTISHAGTSEVKKQVSFNIGDAVGVKTRSGIMNGKIIKYASRRFLVKFDESGYQDMWTLPEHLVKL